LYSKILADFASDVNPSALPEEVVEATKLAVLDWLGCALAGAPTPAGRIFAETFADFRGPPVATLLNGAGRDSSLNAATVNGALSHIVELDDVHKGGVIHAGAVVIPAALAAAQETNAGGRAFLTGVAVGFDVCIRIAEAVTASHYLFFHNTATCGTFGSATAVGNILGLDRQRMLWALGSAGTQAAGLWEFNADGAMSKHLHAGKAAGNGLLSAYLALRGFTGTGAILEGKRGFFAAMAKEVNAAKITDGLGEPGAWKILENTYKPHASCRHTHPAIDAMLAFAGTPGFSPEAIEGIEVRTYRDAMNIAGITDPGSTYEAKFSLPFCIASATLFKSTGLADFTQDRLENIELRRLIRATRLVVDEEVESRYPKMWPVRIIVTLADGSRLEGGVDYPKGDPENPLAKAELQDKFRRLAGPVVGDREAERLVGEMEKLDRASTVEGIIPLFEGVHK